MRLVFLLCLLFAGFASFSQSSWEIRSKSGEIIRSGINLKKHTGVPADNFYETKIEYKAGLNGIQTIDYVDIDYVTDGAGYLYRILPCRQEHTYEETKVGYCLCKLVLSGAKEEIYAFFHENNRASRASLHEQLGPSMTIEGAYLLIFSEVKTGAHRVFRNKKNLKVPVTFITENELVLCTKNEDLLSEEEVSLVSLLQALKCL